MADGAQACSEDNIWSLVSEDDFRQSLVALEQRTNAVPMDVKIFKRSTSPNRIQRSDQLSYCVEERFVNDVAFIVAVNEGAQSVAAVCLEQHIAPRPKAILRVAAADTIDPMVRSKLHAISNIIQSAAEPEISLDAAQDEIFRYIIDLHLTRILGRLRSSRWQKPKYLAASHKKPLWQDFANVVHRVSHVFPSRKDRKRREVVEKQFLEIGSQYEAFETAEGSLDSLIAALVKKTYEFCETHDVQDFYFTLNSSGATAQINAALKCMHQLEKIGSYYRIANNLVRTANSYPTTFSTIELVYLTPYPNQPTTIAYEPWAKTCHVHAEVQLVIDYDMRQDTKADAHPETQVLFPSVIGTSKYFCYLCYLFIKEHGHFFAANTHGRLYDQWTLPDLADYSADLQARYASLLAKMARIIREEAQKLPCWRPEPMTSRQNLLSPEDEKKLHEEVTEESLGDSAKTALAILAI